MSYSYPVLALADAYELRGAALAKAQATATDLLNECVHHKKSLRDLDRIARSMVVRSGQQMPDDQGAAYALGRLYDALAEERRKREEMVSQLIEVCAKLERERMRLAACGVAASGNTATAVKDRISKDHPYYSASYGDVCNSVDREMQARAEIERMTEQIASVQEDHAHRLNPVRERAENAVRAATLRQVREAWDNCGEETQGWSYGTCTAFEHALTKLEGGNQRISIGTGPTLTRVEDTGPKMDRVDPAQVADALGAEPANFPPLPPNTKRIKPGDAPQKGDLVFNPLHQEWRPRANPFLQFDTLHLTDGEYARPLSPEPDGQRRADHEDRCRQL